MSVKIAFGVHAATPASHVAMPPIVRKSVEIT
jgi:hypothetical protein